MPKLVLMVSESIPELPEALGGEKGLTVRRIPKFDAAQPDGDDIVAWLFDDKFVTRNQSALRGASFAPGSVLAWNPGGETPLPDVIAAETLFDEVMHIDRFDRAVDHGFGIDDDERQRIVAAQIAHHHHRDFVLQTELFDFDHQPPIDLFGSTVHRNRIT